MSDQLFSSDPILDIMRFMTSLASFAVAGRELVRIHGELFVDHCRGCAGSGRLTCGHCAGSGSMRSRPAGVSVRRLALLASSPRDVHACPHCGPPSPYDRRPDLDESLDGDPPQAENIRQNIKAALLGRVLLPATMPVYAGTVACPHCGGQPRVKRFTPALRALLPVDPPFQTRASLRAGDILAPDTDPRRAYGEPPSAPPLDPLVPAMVAAAKAGRAAVAARTYDEPGRAKKLKKNLLARADDAMRPFFEEVVGVSAAKGGGVDDADADGGGGGGGGGGDGFEE